MTYAGSHIMRRKRVGGPLLSCFGFLLLSSESSDGARLAMAGSHLKTAARPSAGSVKGIGGLPSSIRCALTWGAHDCSLNRAAGAPEGHYRGTSLIRKRTPLGPCRRPMPRVVGGSQGGGRFLMSEVPL